MGGKNWEEGEKPSDLLEKKNCKEMESVLKEEEEGSFFHMLF